ncbi:Hypothetical_protein [Hexamita inflata]|uniref:Hypothetical_protein n=1 Tax=Hexamita inflata TaxID=28002 RepID=A0AA86NAS1_9EUKA|nr:Hypothetical protein HINF_LOCUS3413 [Hexamita inflata]
MPFVVTTNQTYLEIEWTENLDAQELNIQNIHDSYSFINIAGWNTEQQFPYYEILNRAQSLRISEATIDLSKIKGPLFSSVDSLLALHNYLIFSCQKNDQFIYCNCFICHTCNYLMLSTLVSTLMFFVMKRK